MAGDGQRADAAARRLFTKVVLADDLGLAEPRELIARRRAAYLRSLGELERVLAGGEDDATTALVVEGAALHLAANLTWLDRCEAVLAEKGRT